MDKTSLIQRQVQLEIRIKGSAHWFYWIAVLSLMNSVVVLSGGYFNFIFGIGTTQILDNFAYYLTPQYGVFITYIAVAIDVFVACLFIMAGKLAGQRKKWAFIIGMIFYAIDGLIFLLWSDYLSMSFHGFALYMIVLALPAIKKLEEVERKLAEEIPVNKPIIKNNSIENLNEEITYDIEVIEEAK